MGHGEIWLLGDLFRMLGIRRSTQTPQEPPQVPPLQELRAACSVLMGGIGEASRRAVAVRVLSAYEQLDDAGRTEFFRHLLQEYGVDAEVLTAAFQAWRTAPGHSQEAELFTAAEPSRQELLRRINHAPGATPSLVEMRADLRRLMREDPELRPLDQDFHHLLSSWFNRGFLRLEEITWDSPRQIHRHMLRFEKVHPMADRHELKRRLAPKDRRCYAFFHPATGDVPLIFVEVALVQGIPSEIGPILRAEGAISPSKADTAALYSINNALVGLAGISFGNFLIKQVIEQVRAELPHLENFVTLSPIPGFRRWWEQRGEAPQDPGPDADHAAIEPQVILPALARYIAEEKRADGRPLDSVARFHLGNGASAWQLHWPADTSPASWGSAYGAMITYRYEPEKVEQRHEAFVRQRAVAVGPQLERLLERAAPEASAGSDHQNSQNHSSAESGTSQKERISMTERTIHQAFLDQAQRRPDKILFDLPGGRKVTYDQTLQTSQRIAAKLVGDGVRPGDRVAMQVEKSPEAVALYLATLQIGGIFLPLNTAYTGAEMDYFVDDAAPKVLVCDPSAAAQHTHRSSTGLMVETLGTEQDGTLLQADAPHAEVHPAQPDEPASILYTSGTTGRSKGAVLTHRNLASNCRALLETWQYTSEDRLIHALPIFHIHGLFVAVNMTLTAGASMYWLSTFDADAILDLLPQSTVLMGVPTFYTRLLKSDRLTREVCSGVRLFVSGSAPLLAADHETFAERTGHSILERYGMTETGMNTTNPYVEDPDAGGGLRKPGTVGRPFPGVEVRVVSREGGEEVPQGEVGIVEVRGPNVFSGYWQMPEKTAEEFREDGFFITGDLGRIDEDGYLCIVGRDKDLIISGGYNVYPKEVEEVIDDHPAVLESAVVGVPHPDFGETVLAAVVPRDASDSEGLAEELGTLVGERLARFKQPRAYRIIEALPRNVMGKVQKAQLRKQYAETFAAAQV
ncbi:AMP-binding protein [Nesterenkonia cremea]|uniref:Malonyl-CoA synthase n=1 Tax=Nesterenkonia cremea TaxID=1882340 RepID=A0A917ALS3_9MICC|nr:AMP-binding protein [Nesterenkonia cremea]GGE58810.1 hypothetical protein GCM10011401_01900 [Nesterenkonia cremea]